MPWILVFGPIGTKAVVYYKLVKLRGFTEVVFAKELFLSQALTKVLEGGTPGSAIAVNR